MRYLLRLLKFFLLISIAWGLLFGLWLGLYIGIQNGILYGLEGGLIFGFIITAVGALYDYLLRLRIFKKFGVKDFEVIQTREILLPGNIKDIMQKSISVLKGIKGIKKVSPNYEDNKVFAVCGTTWKTFGERIEIRFSQEMNKIKIYIQSRPRLKTAIFDGGKNIENVEIFCSLMNRG